MLTFHGAWRITVLTRDADFEQRAVVRGPHGSRVIPGRAGATLEVDGERWTLALEHSPWGRGWRPNHHTTRGPVTRHDGIRSQVVTSSDQPLPGKPLDYPNLVLRLEQADATVPAALRTPRPLGTPMTPATPATPRAIRTTSSAPTYGPPESRPAQTPAEPAADGHGRSRFWG